MTDETKTANNFKQKRCMLFCRAWNEQAAETQLSELREYARRGSCEVVGEIVLIGVSSASKKAQDAIDSIIMRKRECEDFDELVVADWTRLTRKGAGDAHFLMSVFAKNEIKLVTVDYPIRADDPCPEMELDLSSHSPRALKDRATVPMEKQTPSETMTRANDDQPMRKVAAVIRYSGGVLPEEQSLEAQKYDLEAYAAAKGFELIWHQDGESTK